MRGMPSSFSAERGPAVHTRLVRRCGALLLDDEIERVDLASRLGQQPCEISQALGIAQPHSAAVERDRPVVAFVTESMLFRPRARADLARGRPVRDDDGLCWRGEVQAFEHRPSGCRLGVAACGVAGRRCRVRQVAGGNRDLDVCVEQGRPAQLGVGRQLLRGDAERMVERFLNQRQRQRYVALRKPQQRQAGLWIPASLLCRDERRFRAGEITPPQPDAAQLGQRPAKLAPEVRPQLVTGGERLALRLAAGAAQPENLRAMEATPAMDAAHWLPLPPALHGLRPLLGEVVLRDRLEGADNLAVHDPGRQRIDLAGHGRHRGFVE